ncbi:hypothetical protein AMS68_002825 [Peltaster fructicola]|uniref:UBC core domain-containing protein n=1 Tax=Peltaster fructicola TaxID=286661 RepID=A0A6H0XRP0_9PEZI|nr:hypothetical protein AMS68_002825 [Peltaster fructicola]
MQTFDKVIELAIPDRRGEIRQLDGQPEVIPLRPDIRIKRHASVSVDQYRQYKRTSEPPAGVILVTWPEGPQLIARVKVEVVSRYFTLGEVVARPHHMMTGVVLNTLPTCRLAGLVEATQSDSQTLLRSRTREERKTAQYLPDNSQLITDVPASELERVEDLNVGQIVVYQGWVGTVSETKTAVTLRLTNNSVVEVQNLEFYNDGDEFPSTAFSVGDSVVTTKGVLRTGKWIYGAYSPNVTPEAGVVQVRTTVAMVDWVRMGVAGSTNAPSTVLERVELESADFVAYKPSKLPPSCASPGKLSSVSYPCGEFDELATVRFIDQEIALTKYGNDTNGLVKHHRADHLGYDMNVLTVADSSLKVNVRWQDGTMSQHDSTELMLHEPLDDTESGWPGEIAYSVEVEDLPGEDGVVTPKKVGVVQSIDTVQRIAKIRWCPDARVHLIDILSEGDIEATREVFRYAIGLAAEESEDVSLYDIEIPGSLNVCRGDTVVIQDPQSCGLQDITGINWLGTIVEDRLDGALTIRLAAAEPVQDVVLLREQVSVAIAYDNRSARLQGVDDLDGESYDDEPMDVDDDSDEYDWYDEEPEPTYEDEDGNAMNIDDVEDDDWESIEENDEVPNEQLNEPRATLHGVHKVDQHDNLNKEQTDVHIAKPHDEYVEYQRDLQARDQHNTRTTYHYKHQKQDDRQTADAKDSPMTGNSSKLVTEVKSEEQSAGPETQGAPPSYLLHDSAVPDDHHFSTCPASTISPRMRQIQKEHGIFQKPGAIPDGVYVRSWESRPDLWRVLFIGPEDTPYADAPFIVDFYLPTDYPQSPPQAFFHSWNGESSLAGVGKVNPNLYEDGKICLSLLGTWEGHRHENWTPKKSTLLQVVVSLLGLVLVREPYFNEAGYEDQVGTEEAKRPSILYTERVVLRSLNFAISATAALQAGRTLAGMQALEDVLHWLYLNVVHGAGLLAKLHRRVQTVLGESAAAGVAFDGLNSMSQGACISLRRVLARLDQLISNL